MTETQLHPVYPEGPPCDDHCPGTWSTWHDGYASGHEIGSRAVGAKNSTISEQVEHWCIKPDCKHGTLNGSIALGSMYLKEYQRGYKQAIVDYNNKLHEHKSINDALTDTYFKWRKINKV